MNADEAREDGGGGDTTNSVLHRVDRILGALGRLCLFIGAAFIAIMTLYIVVDVVGRWVGLQVVGTAEISSYGLVILTFLFLPYLIRARQNIRSTVVVDRVGERGKRIIDMCAYLLGFVLFALIVYGSFGLMVTAWQTAETSTAGILRVPTFPARLVIVFGSALAAIECLVVAGKALFGVRADDAIPAFDDETSIDESTTGGAL